MTLFPEFVGFSIDIIAVSLPWIEPLKNEICKECEKTGVKIRQPRYETAKDISIVFSYWYTDAKRTRASPPHDENAAMC